MSDWKLYEIDRTQKELEEAKFVIGQLEVKLNQLAEELNIVEGELKLTRAEVVAQTKAKEATLTELQRLKEGHFTDEELSNLCHNLPPDSVCKFRKGCQEYQVKLFGEEKLKAEVARELRWALKQVSSSRSMEDLAEAISFVIIDAKDYKPPCKES